MSILRLIIFWILGDVKVVGEIMDKQKAIEWVKTHEKRVELTELEKSLNPDDWFDEKYLFWLDFDEPKSNVVRVYELDNEEQEKLLYFDKGVSDFYKQNYYWFYENFGLNMLGYPIDDLRRRETAYYGYSLMSTDGSHYL